MEDYQEILTEEIPDKGTLTALKLFWLGFIIYIVSFTISTSDQVNYVVCNIFQIFGLLLLVPSAILLIRFKFENKYLRIIYFLYCCWLLGVIIRGIEFDYLSVKRLLFDPNAGFFLYLVPLVMLFPKDPKYLKKVFDVIIFFCFVFFIYDLIFLKLLLYPLNDMRSQAIIEYFSQQLGLPGGFLLLTFVYHTRKRNLLVLITLLFMFILTVIRARRGLMFMSFSMIAFSYFIYQLTNKEKVVTILFSLLLVLSIYYAGEKIYNENRKDTFFLITERIGQRTRTGVEQYFFSDLKTKDWILGRGINGKYFCPGVEEGIGRVSIFRRVIETGYLQVILNGGLVSLGLLLLIAIPAIIKGLFFSKNILSKASGVWIFLFLLFMYPGTMTIFSLNYILVWMSIGICYSNQIRNMPDTELKELLSTKRKLF